MSLQAAAASATVLSNPLAPSLHILQNIVPKFQIDDEFKFKHQI
jgi:hypothetical protein